MSAPALPGHAGAVAPEALSDAFSVIGRGVDELGGRAHLVGYSLGGRLALHYAFAHPQRVSALTLFGARPGLSDAKEREERLAADRRWSAMLRREGLEAFLEHWEAQSLLQPVTEDAAAVAEARAIRRRHSASGLADAMEAFSVAALPDLWPSLGELPMPVTWGVGEHDAHYRPIMARAAEKAGRLRVIPRAGHSVLIDNPRAVADLLLD